MRIAVRFGHTILINGQNTSATGIRREYELIREYAPLVVKYLQLQGYTVLNVTPKDKSYSTEIQDINAGIKMANDWGADLFLSLHANNFDKKAHGCEVLYSKGNTEGEKYAINICKELETLGFKNRGAKFDIRGLNEIARTHMISCIIEPFFCDSEIDMKLYNSDKIAKAIVKGVSGKEVVDKITVVFPTPQNDIKNVSSKSRVEYCRQWQIFYNNVTLTKSRLLEDNIYGKNTQNSLDSLLVYIKQGKKYKYCYEFQRWFNMVTDTSKPLVCDGIFGENSMKAYNIINELIKKH